MQAAFHNLISATVNAGVLDTRECTTLKKTTSCRMISHTDNHFIKKTAKLATTRELAFHIFDADMVNGTKKKESKGLQPFLRRSIKGSENMITFISEVSKPSTSARSHPPAPDLKTQ